MKKTMLVFLVLLSLPIFAYCQNESIPAKGVMTPELLWRLGRVTALGISRDKKWIVYSVTTPDVQSNQGKKQSFALSVDAGEPIPVANPDSLLINEKLSPDGKYLISASDVKLENVLGKDYYPELSLSNVRIYDHLNYRHWDEWEDGAFSHVFIAPVVDGKPGPVKDIMPGEQFDCPQKPFGGDEDFIWEPDSKHIIYVTKKSFGTSYAVSTNSDLYEYDVEKGTTKDLTADNKGYDINPAFSSQGQLAWLQMKREGYESDKQDLIIVVSDKVSKNLTKSRNDINVESFKWSDDGKFIYFISPVNGTLQLFKVNNPGSSNTLPKIEQVTSGDFDITGIVGQDGNSIIITRTDMNHAAEIFNMDITSRTMKQVTHVNDSIYAGIGQSKTIRRFVKTTDGKNMLVWVIYPPDFDSLKKQYPTLLYCQGGPQSSLTQFYSFRWNFQLMAANGYIVVAPCRRGMPGFGTKWNEQVSKDWGGQVLKDYLSAIDAVSKEKYVDKKRLGCIGASFGGYSVFALQGIHNGRFKTFIAHDGSFDFRQMYLTTDEMWFENWERGGAYWDKKNVVAQRSFSQSPSNFVDKWKTPMLVFHGGKDYRIPAEQGFAAFQVLQLKGIKSRLVFLPDENHWVLSAQNAQVWQHEFYKWLKETL